MKQQDDLEPLLQNLTKSELETNLKNLTSFHTRYYKSDYGRQSSEWLLSRVQTIIREAGADKHGVEAEHFTHPWGQNSIIARIPGKSNSTVVVGAHQDSINLWLPSVLAAPGADDDGSGTVTILEAFRVLLRSADIVGGKAENTVEFHWYSAEEGGLLGSQAIFSSYEKARRDVKAMLQQDMTGFVKRTVDAGQVESVGVIVDFVDPQLTKFIKKVIEEVRNRRNKRWDGVADLFSTARSPGSRPGAGTPAPTTPRRPRRATPPRSSSSLLSSTRTTTSTRPTTSLSICRSTT